MLDDRLQRWLKAQGFTVVEVLGDDDDGEVEFAFEIEVRPSGLIGTSDRLHHLLTEHHIEVGEDSDAVVRGIYDPSEEPPVARVVLEVLDGEAFRGIG